MLALTHHLIVQYAAYLALKKFSLFTKYIILGDDIVIADKAVADHYYNLMTEVLKVKINLAKGLISNIGALEFAKRFMFKGEDLSGLSLKEFSSFGSVYSSFTSALLKFNPSSYNLNKLLGKGSISSGNANILTKTMRTLITLLRAGKDSKFDLLKYL